MRKLKKRFFGVLFLFLCILLIPKEKVSAGEVNGAEQQVISAASGTFQYDGETYRAYPEYIAQLRNYFARDDVNLAQSEVNGLIADMNSSIKDGIDSGYLYRTGPKKKKEQKENVPFDQMDKEETSQEEDTKENQHTDKKFDIEKSVDDGKIFYKSEDSVTSVELVIKNTGYDITPILIIFSALVLLSMLIIGYILLDNVFAPRLES